MSIEYKNRSSYWVLHLRAFSFFPPLFIFVLFLFAKALNPSSSVDKSVAVGALGVQVMHSICNLLHAAGTRVQAEPGWLKGDVPLLLSTAGQMHWFNVLLSIEGEMESGNLCAHAVQSDWDPLLSVSMTHLLSQRSPGATQKYLCYIYALRLRLLRNTEWRESGWRRNSQTTVMPCRKQRVRKRQLQYGFWMRFECVCGDCG